MVKIGRIARFINNLPSLGVPFISSRRQLNPLHCINTISLQLEIVTNIKGYVVTVNKIITMTM
jgi:hypothetical protein